MLEQRPSHSPLGGSGAARWMKCPGSVGLSVGIEDEESEYAAEGTAAHELLETCLNDHTEPWMHVGKILYGDFEVTKEMADAVNVCTTRIRSNYPDRNQGNTWVEREFYVPKFHEYFWGKGDFIYLDRENRILHVWDYKHGAGIVVDAPYNVQLMYYAVGLLFDLMLWDDVDTVKLTIAQPRGFHHLGAIRSWSIDVKELEAWAYDELQPAMDKALSSDELQTGEHCRFCPARSYYCPAIAKDMQELLEMVQQIERKGAQTLTNAQVGRYLQLFRLSKLFAKDIEKIAFTRMSSGGEIEGSKLGPARVNRDWKKGAEAALVKKFGNKAYTEPALKSPAQIEAIPQGEQLIARWAYKPEGKLTIMAASDPREAAIVSHKHLFQDETKKKQPPKKRKTRNG